MYQKQFFLQQMCPFRTNVIIPIILIISTIFFFVLVEILKIKTYYFTIYNAFSSATFKGSTGGLRGFRGAIALLLFATISICFRSELISF
jgi:hypothetical protein